MIKVYYIHGTNPTPACTGRNKLTKCMYIDRICKKTRNSKSSVEYSIQKYT